MRRLWPRRPGMRALVVVVAFFALANLAAFVTSTVRPEPSGETGSAQATQPRGAAAYAELLRRSGHPVRLLRTPLAESSVDPRATLVVLDAGDLDAADREALSRFVGGGGRLVAAGRDPGRWLAGLRHRPDWAAKGPRDSKPLLPLAETRGVERVATNGAGGFRDAGGALLAAGGDGGLLVVAREGDGRALLLADAYPLENRGLGRADNARLALGLAGEPGRPVVFAESVHGLGDATGLAALPLDWKVALGGLVLAALLWLLSQARRLGPPEELGAEPAPARREHVEALALALRDAHDPAGALAPVQAQARAHVLRRARLPPASTTDAELHAAALRIGYDEDEARALTGAIDADSALAVGRALQKGRR